MTAWTSDPPEREGWYWVTYPDPTCDPFYFKKDVNGQWTFGGWRVWSIYKGSIRRSVEPLTPPEPPK